MKTNFKKTTAILAICFTAFAFIPAKAQDNYAFAIHDCVSIDKSTLIIMVSNVFNIEKAKQKFSNSIGYQTVERFEKLAISAAETEGITLSCDNSFIVYTKGPGEIDEGLSNYIDRVANGQEGVDFVETDAYRKKAIAKLRDKYSAQYKVKVINITLF